MAVGDRYFIDRDERSLGGELIRIATFEDWREAKRFWDTIQPDPREGVSLFFAKEGPKLKGCTTLNCK